MFVKFPSIEQYHHLLKSARKTFLRKDNEASSLEIDFIGTVKVHGTNAGAVWNVNSGLHAQSRNRIITEDNDNFDFASFVAIHSTAIKSVMQKIATQYNIDLKDEHAHFALFGEYCCDNIQAKVALTGLKPRKWIVYDAAILTTGEGEEQIRWLDILDEDFSDHQSEIYNIATFGLFKFRGDFNDLEPTREFIKTKTLEVEDECPVGKYFGRNKAAGDCTTGEGVVWRVSKVFRDGVEMDLTQFPKLSRRFKHKGELHATNYKSTNVPLVPERMAEITEFVQATVTEQRLEQGFTEIVGQHEEQPQTKIGTFAEWVIADILKEDMDHAPVLSDLKHFKKAVSYRSVKWFKQKINLME